MPELPEVETMCRGIWPIVGGRIVRLADPHCRYRPVACEPAYGTIAKRVAGLKITGIARVGKRVVVQIDPWALILQPKMTGLVSIEQPPGPEHVRLILELSGCKPKQLYFWDRRGLGTIQLLRQDEVEPRLVHGKLGTDALVISCEEFIERLSSTSRAIKVALLDQKLLAGVGNLYASEMLHAAGIDPQKAACEVSKARYRMLHEHMLRILNDAIIHEGSTLSDGTYRNALNQDGNYQDQHQVYDRAGQVCPRCLKGKIERIVQAQRSTFYCKRCQR